MKDRIAFLLLITLSCINSGCTTNRVMVDDHSYHHNDVPPQNTSIIHNHYPQPVMIQKPSVQQLDREYLQFQQNQSPVSQESGNGYTPQMFPNANRYPQVQSYFQPYGRSYAYSHSTPGYSSNVYAYKAHVRAQLGF